MDIIIRKMEICDIPDMIKLNDEFNGIGATFDSMKDSLENNSREIVFVAVNDINDNDNEIIGFICAQLYQSICYVGLQCEITELFVREEYRRNGIAKKLIKQIEAEFKKHDGYEITLETGKDNIAAQRFYESCGYKRDGEIVYCKILKGENS